VALIGTEQEYTVSFT